MSPERITDLEYALFLDIFLFAYSYEEMQIMLTNVSTLMRIEFRLNVIKMKIFLSYIQEADKIHL